jgi:hypothetical protein
MRLSRGYGAVDLADQGTEDSHHKTAPSPFWQSASAVHADLCRSNSMAATKRCGSI